MRPKPMKPIVRVGEARDALSCGPQKPNGDQEQLGHYADISRESTVNMLEAGSSMYLSIFYK